MNPAAALLLTSVFDKHHPGDSDGGFLQPGETSCKCGWDSDTEPWSEHLVAIVGDRFTVTPVVARAAAGLDG